MTAGEVGKTTLIHCKNAFIAITGQILRERSVVLIQKRIRDQVKARTMPNRLNPR
ncbi:hypothetical protein D3C80_2243110 [compost metagenome]